MELANERELLDSLIREQEALVSHTDRFRDTDLAYLVKDALDNHVFEVAYLTFLKFCKSTKHTEFLYIEIFKEENKILLGKKDLTEFEEEYSCDSNDDVYQDYQEIICDIKYHEHRLEQLKKFVKV